MTDLTGKRVLILGAETEVGRAVATAVAEAGGRVAAVAATSDAEAAFAVQRLARRLSSGERKVIAQAIDATNEAAVRVMVRQVSKELGGLDAFIVCGEPGEGTRSTAILAVRSGRKELVKTRGVCVVLGEDPRTAELELMPGMTLVGAPLDRLSLETAVQYTVRSVAGRSNIG